MPTYAYKCTDCSHEFEKFLKQSDVEPKQCPKCLLIGYLEKQLFATPFRGSGAGWNGSKSQRRGNEN